MISVFNFLKNLNYKRRIQISILVLATILTNFAEVLSIALIPPFLAIISDQSIIDTNYYLLSLKQILNLNDTNFLIFLAISIFILILCSNIFLSLISYLTKMLINAIKNNLLSDLFNYYINLKFEETFLNKNSYTKITTKINNEVLRFCDQTLLCFFEILKRIFAIIIMITILFVIEPLFTSYIVLFFLVVSLIYYFGFQNKLMFFGKKVTDRTEQKFSLVMEAFSALKEVKFLGIEKIMMREFFKNNVNLTKVDVILYMYANLPRYILEVVSSLLFFSILIFFILTERDFETMIYTMSFVVVAAYKILPALNQIMFNFTVFKSSLPAYHFIKDDLEIIKQKNRKIEKNLININSYEKIELKNLTYKYPGTDYNALNNININFETNKNYFILGSSGSGKSTLIDILCGIIEPRNFDYIINTKFKLQDIKNINQILSYVPQQINFFNRTLLENITLKFNKVSKDDIIFVNEIIQILNLNELIDNLPHGINSYVGENIQNMSGGQRQRISIARALFRKKPILIFDEATSAIDNVTERMIYERITKLSFIKTLISVTHRENILVNDDNCIIMDKGNIKFIGKYKNFKKNLYNK